MHCHNTGLVIYHEPKHLWLYFCITGYFSLHTVYWTLTMDPFFIYLVEKGKNFNQNQCKIMKKWFELSITNNYVQHTSRIKNQDWCQWPAKLNDNSVDLAGQPIECTLRPSWIYKWNAEFMNANAALHMMNSPELLFT